MCDASEWWKKTYFGREGEGEFGEWRRARYQFVHFVVALIREGSSTVVLLHQGRARLEMLPHARITVDVMAAAALRGCGVSGV